MITIHHGSASDFSGLGMGALTPTECSIREEAGGMYELTMRHPIDRELRHSLIAPGRIIKAPAPVRETPYAEIQTGGESSTVSREIYRVYNVSSTLRLRTAPGTSAGKVISGYRAGTEVAKLEDAGSADGHTWYRVAILDGGATGYMAATYLQYVRTETEVIQNDTPGTVIRPTQAREQLFRICGVERAMQGVTITAQHIFYDLKGVAITGTHKFEGVGAASAVAEILAAADHEHPFRIYCGVSGEITGEYSGRSLVDCLLNPEDGILAQTGGRLVRDNFDVFLLPDQGRDPGIEIRKGKNLISAAVTTDIADVVTRIIPVGQKADGTPLVGAAVDSEHIGEYAEVYAKQIEYSVRVNEDAKEEADRMTEERALAKLEEMARADFDAGIDLPTVSMDADFVRMELAPEYADMANTYALHMYDSVPVIDPDAGITAQLRMTGYAWDALMQRYTETTLGDLENLEIKVEGYQLGGGISGTKILPGTASGSILRDLSVGYAKIGTAAIEQLAADAITAVRADIRKLVAEEITTDQLYADLATIAAACITTANIQNANIDWAQIENLTAAIVSIAKAQITTANIGEANIEWAEIENLSAFIVTTAKAQITTANIQNANIDWAQVSTLMAEVATVAKAQITTANINQANIDWASIATLSAVMADIADARIGSATISTAQIDQLEAEVARILSVQIATGEFDFASVQNLVASAMVLEQGTGGSIYITNLAVTSATILSATMGELVVQGEDGKYYEITVMADGTIATKEVTVTEGEIAAGETAGGKGIVATTANVAELNAQTVKASSAIISEILVGALTAEKITAQQALIASATVPELYATSIKAIGDSLDLSSNQSIRLYVAGEIEDVHVGSRNYIRNSRDFDYGDYGVVTRETSGVWQEGDTLVIVSGVNVAQDGGVLQIS